MDGDINSSSLSSIDCVHRTLCVAVYRLKANTQRVQETK